MTAATITYLLVAAVVAFQFLSLLARAHAASQRRLVEDFRREVAAAEEARAAAKRPPRAS